MTRFRKGLVISILAAAVFMGALAFSHSVNAGIGPGGNSTPSSGCNGGGIRGCPWSSNSHGWYKIPLNSGWAPKGDASYWNAAYNTCRNEGASHVIAYVMFTGERDIRYGWVYQFQDYWYNKSRGVWESYTSIGPYNASWVTIGDAVGMTRDQAKSVYDNLPAWQRVGYTFGGRGTGNVGWMCYHDSNWSSTGTSTVNQTTAKPGDRLEWSHSLTNNGPTVSSDIYSQLYLTGFRGDPSFSDGAKDGQRGALPTYGTRSHTSYTAYTVRQADVGSTLCQQLQWDPTNSSGERHGRSTNACVSVPYNYDLTPSISVSPRVAEAGASLRLDGSVNNAGPTSSRATDWAIERIIYSPGVAPLNAGGGETSRVGCDYFTNGGRTGACSVIQTGTGEVFGMGVTPKNTTTTVDDVAVGSRICFALSVRPYDESTSNARHSALQCMVVSKSPKVQVQGGDLIVGRTSPTVTAPTSGAVVNTSTSTKASTTYGSWSEYAIMASGCVNGMASGAGYASGGSSTTSLSSPNLSMLTFTNPSGRTCSSGLGGYAHITQAPNVAARFPILVSAADATPARPASPAILPGTRSGSTVTTNIISNNLSGVYQAPSGVRGITLTGGSSIPAGRTVVINAPDATVTITGDIRYTTAGLTRVTDIPQVVVIASNIIISDAVQNIDAWLVAVGTGADGAVNTCGAGGVTQTSNLVYTQCANRLTVNGPVMANHLVLRRTGGSGAGADSGKPAEVFNLRADVYMWATTLNQQSGRISTAAIKELPPRY